MVDLAKQIIDKQTELIDTFDQWVRKVKLNEMEEASDIVKRSNQLRAELVVLKKQYEKAGKKIVLLN